MHKSNPAGRFGSTAPAPPWSIDQSPRTDELDDLARCQLDSSAPVSRVMQRAVVCVSERLSVDEVRGILLESRLGAAPVVNARGFPVGVVSAIDILRELPEYETRAVDLGHSRSTGLDPFADETDDDAEALDGADGFRVMRVLHEPVSSLMVPLACCVRQDSTLQSAAMVMAAEHLHHLPVVDANGHLVGMLCSLDVVGFVAGLPAPVTFGLSPKPRLIAGEDP